MKKAVSGAWRAKKILFFGNFREVFRRLGGKFPVDCQLCASLSLPFFAYWGAPRHNRRHSFQRTLPRVRLGMPVHKHTCKNRKTYLRPTAVSWGPYLLPSPQPAKGKYSVNLVIPAAHLPFPAKLHPMRQVQEVSKKGGAPHRLPCLLLYHIILFHIFYMAFFYHNISGIFGHLLHKPWQTCRMHCRASLGLDASSAPMVRTIPLARAARSSA